MEKRFHLFVSLMLSIVVTIAFGQSEKEHLEQDKLAVDTLFFKDRAEGLEISERALPLAYQLNDTFYITYFLDQAGELNRFAGNYQKAITQLEECLEYKVHWTDLKDLSITHNNLSKVYITLGRNEEAFEHLKIALELMDRSENLMGQGYYLNNIAILFENQKNYQKAIEYYNKSKEIKKITKDTTGFMTVNFNMGICYDKLGDKTKAFSLIQEYLENGIRINDSLDVARGANKLAKILIEEKRVEEAIEYLKIGKNYLANQTDRSIELNLKISQVEVFRAQGNFDLAEKELLEIESLVKNSGSFLQRFSAYRTFSNYYAKSQQFEKAFEYLRLSNTYNDSIINKENIYAVNEIEGKYEYEKNLRLRQEAELESLKKDKDLYQRNIYLILSGTLLFLVLILAIYFISKNKTNKKMVLYKNAQNVLLNRQKDRVGELNNNLKMELAKTHMTIEEQSLLLERAFDKSKDAELPEFLVSLSKREFEVLANLALGLTDDELAEKLFVSKATVKTHLRRIYSKLLVKNRAGAVAIAHKYNIIGEISPENDK